MPGSDEQEFSEMTDPTQTTSEPHDQTGSYVQKGESFQRDMNYIPTRITREGEEGYPVEAGRYRLAVARACPWANRAVIDRRLDRKSTRLNSSHVALSYAVCCL